MSTEITKQLRTMGVQGQPRTPLYNPDYVDEVASELLLDAQALDNSDLYWVAAPMATLAVEYADSDAPWRPSVEAPSDHGLLLFADCPLTVCPLPPHGVPIPSTGDMFASWMPNSDLPEQLPRVPLAGFRWAIRGDVIDISFYVRRDQLREVFQAADAAGNFLHPRELVHRERLLADHPADAVDETVARLPTSVKWMSTYTLDSETTLIEWERIELSAHEDFSVVESVRARLGKADPSNGLWLAGSIVPSVWTMMKSPKVSKTSRSQVVRKVKSLGGSRVNTLSDDVSIIDVRPYEFKPHAQAGTGRKITVRFLVRGHMSTYWTGPGKKVPRRTFIAPYWKGTPEMPIKDAEQVRILR